jgi:altronate dehydratase small subunit
MAASDDARLLLLHPADNVFVLTATLGAGESYAVGGEEYLNKTELRLGHKIARVDIPAGGKILKYGVAIGSAIVPIRRGDHVHLHNLQSDYLPTYTLDKEHHFGNIGH